MNPEHKEMMERAGMRAVTVPGSPELTDWFGDPRKSGGGSNTDYYTRVRDITKNLPDPTQMNNGATIGFGGYNMTRKLNARKGMAGEVRNSIDTLNELQQQNRIIFYDIESMGKVDSKNKTFSNFGLTEIAATEFEWQNGKLVPTSNKLSMLIKPQESISILQDLIGRVEKNPYAFNKFEDWQKRMLVDSMRYSSEGANGATFNPIKKNGNVIGHDIKHNPIVDSLFKNEMMIESEVVRSMDQWLPHMKSGAGVLNSNIAFDKTTAESKWKTFLDANKNTYFMGHNTKNFDNPALKHWGGSSAMNPTKHADWFQILSSVFPNPDDYYKSVIGPMPEGYSMGMRKLQQIGSHLGIDPGSAHAAEADLKLLAGVIERTLRLVGQTAKNAEEAVQGFFMGKPNKMTYSNKPLTVGSQLFATTGMNAKSYENEMSFQIDENGKLTVDDFQNNFINAKTLYEVQGQEVLDKKKNRLALRLYDKYNKHTTYLVREGENAAQELQEIVESRFYDWDDISDKEKNALYRSKVDDLARRRYDRMHSLEHGGTGRAGGFESARRMYRNAEILDFRVKGKESNIKDMVTEISAAQALKESKETGEPYQEAYKRFKKENIRKFRIKDSDLAGPDGMMNFDSMIDKDEETLQLNKDEKGNLLWNHNPTEQQQFWSMKERLISELDVYMPAIEHIENVFDPQIEEAQKRGDRESVNALRQQREVAWKIYTSNLRKNLETHAPKYLGGNRAYEDKNLTELLKHKKEVSVPDYENMYFHATDYSNRNNKKHRMNLESLDTARGSLYGVAKHIKDDKFLTEEQKSKRSFEKLGDIVRFMGPQFDGAISAEDHDRMMGILKNTATLDDAITRLAYDMRENKKLIQKSREQASLKANDILKDIAIDEEFREQNKLLYQSSIEKSKDLLSSSVHVWQNEGSKASFSPTTEKYLSHLDEVHDITGLDPKNRQALESILSAVKERSRSKNKKGEMVDRYNYGLSLDKETGNATITVTDTRNGYSAINSLIDGQSPSNTLDIHVPLANRQGVHVLNGRKLNARRFMDYTKDAEGKGVFTYESSTQRMAKDIVDNLPSILGELNAGKGDEASERARKTLNRSAQNLSGIQRSFLQDIGDNDTFWFQRSKSDYKKQSMVDASRAMIKQMYDQGQLKESDFKPQAFVENQLIRNVSLDDLQYEASNRVVASIGKFLQDNNLPLYLSGVKDDPHASNAIVATMDSRDTMTYGAAYNQTRSNPVQFDNMKAMPEQTKSALEKQDFYTSFEDRVASPMERLIENDWRTQNPGHYSSVNLKVALMDNDMIHKRMGELAETHTALLTNKGYLKEYRKDGNHVWDEAKFPRVYEQQITMAEDLKNNLTFTDVKKVTKGSGFQAAPGLSHGNTVKPGDFIGTEKVNGYTENIYWEGKYEGRFLQQGDQASVQFEDTAFKSLFDGEKGTHHGIDKEIMDLMTQDPEVSVIAKPKIKGRQESMIMAGKSRILGDHLADLHSNKKMPKKERNRRINDIMRMIDEEGLALTWDAKTKTLTENTREVIDRDGTWSMRVQDYEKDAAGNLMLDENEKPIEKARGFDRVFEHIAKETNSPRLDQTAAGQEALVSKFIMSNVHENYKYVDPTNRQVLRYNAAGNPVYKEGFDGVSYGHREMWAFETQGMKETHKYLTNAMREQAGGGEEYQGKHVSRLQEGKNMLAALTASAYDDHAIVDKTDAIDYREFAMTPYETKGEFGYDQTIFDHSKVHSLLGEKNQKPVHGFHMKLPEVRDKSGNIIPFTMATDTELEVSRDENGREKKQTKTTYRNVDKVFIPATNLEGANGNVHLRGIQHDINDIYRKANDLDNATDENRMDKHEKLQNALHGFQNRLKHELTSSQGHMGENVNKARMGNSFSATTKLIDPKISENLKGEYAMISKNRAIELGVFEALDAGEDVFAQHLRYPTFHKDSSQTVKLMIGDVSDREIHLTAAAGSLTKADSDGDTGHLWVARDQVRNKKGQILSDEVNQDLQKEWARHYEAVTEKRDQELKKLIREVEKETSDPKNSFLLKEMHKNGLISSQRPNEATEVVAKVGKNFIGSASNLGMSMRALSDEFLRDNKELHDVVYQFTQDLEQKPISSKHISKSLMHGDMPAFHLISALKKGDFKKAFQIDRDYYDSTFANDSNMEKAMKAMNVINERSKGTGMMITKFGTSSGVGEHASVKQAVDIMHGQANVDETLRTVSFVNMMHKAFGVEPQKIQTPDGEERVQVSPYRSLEEQERIRLRDDGLAGAAGSFAESATGSESVGNKVNDFVKDITSTKAGKVGIWTAVGAGVLGIGYNVLKHDEPLETPGHQEIPTADYAGSGTTSSLPPIDYGHSQQNAEVHISAKGSQSVDKGQMSMMVEQGMRESNMRAGATRVTVTQTDNTNSLNKIWYRDKIEENI